MPDSGVRRITWRSADVVRVLGLGFLFLFLWKFFWLVYPALFLALLAVLIAIVLHVPARLLSRWIPFRLAFAIVLLLFVGGLIGLLVAMIPQVVEQGTQLATQIPETLRSLDEWFARKTGGQADPARQARIQQQLEGFAARFLPAALNTLTTVLGSFAIIVLAAFLAAEPRMYRDLVLSLVPEDRRPRWARLLDEAGNNLRAWVIGKAFTMLAVGVATYFGLTFLGVPGAMALAAFAALMEFIPNFGPTIAAIPAMIAGFAVAPATAVYVAIFYFLLQQVQNAITVPLVERRAVNIPPAALLIWQLMLAFGFGVVALFVATPLLAVLVVAVRILYVEPSEDLQRWDRREPDTPTPAADIAHSAEVPGNATDQEPGAGGAG
ncbi:MAG TPA: AI-2E family transporter [Longimicrobium sp.]|jgi:predicted PurR-regulated permease PerM